jgi:3-isopropylmalate/(R)-2-methylmalate dehydratase small subunit
MQAVTVIEGIAAPLLRENIDTDVIIPSRDITSPSREGLGPRAFAPWRYLAGSHEEDPQFVLNRAPWRHAPILITGANFGCGSSREMAVWALVQYGIRCIVAPSFGAIFRNNCVRNALLPVELPAEVVATLAADAQAQALMLTVDLRLSELRGPGGIHHRFTLPDDDREMLLSGQDAIDRTWQWRSEIEAFEVNDRVQRPWAWLETPP